MKTRTKSRVPKVKVQFDCPWTGHLYDPTFVVRNVTAPTIEGRRCVKCACLIYVLRDAPSPIVGPEGQELAPAGPKLVEN